MTNEHSLISLKRFESFCDEGAVHLYDHRDQIDLGQLRRCLVVPVWLEPRMDYVYQLRHEQLREALLLCGFCSIIDVALEAACQGQVEEISSFDEHVRVHGRRIWRVHSNDSRQCYGDPRREALELVSSRGEGIYPMRVIGENTVDKEVKQRALVFVGLDVVSNG